MRVVIFPTALTLAIHLLLTTAEIAGWFEIPTGKRFLIAWLTTAFGGIYLALKTYSENSDLQGMGDMDAKEALGGCVGMFVLIGLLGGLIGQKAAFLRHPVTLILLYGSLIAGQFAIWPPFSRRLLIFVTVARIPEIIILFFAATFSWNGYHPAPVPGFNRYLLVVLPFTFVIGSLMGMIGTLIAAGTIDRRRDERAQAGAVLSALAIKPTTWTQEDLRSIMEAAISSTADRTSDPRSPDMDLKELEQSAQSLLDNGQLSEAEEKITQALTQDGRSESARKLWKRIRQAQSKPLSADITEEKRRKIYRYYEGLSTLLSNDRIVLDLRGAANPHEHLAAILEESGAKANDSALKEFAIHQFELDLILQEGEREAWRVPVFDSGKELPPDVKPRDALRCVHCRMRNATEFWPDHGSDVLFYPLAEEEMQKNPGALRLRIVCPFCKTKWFAVWPESPDPIAGQFLDHIQRICRDLNSDDAEAFYNLISDSVLGEVLKFVKGHTVTSVERGVRSERSFQTGEFDNLIWLLPVRMEAARDFLSDSYLYLLQCAAQEWDEQGRIRHFVHWIYCFEKKTGSANLCFLPRQEAANRLATIFPFELLNPEDRSRPGIET